MTRGQPHHLPLGPLLELTRTSSPARLAMATGLDEQTAKRTLKRGWLTVTMADRAALHLGRHPVNIWPTWGEGNCLQSVADSVPP